MLKKQHRLKSRYSFKRALSGPRLCSTDYFNVYGMKRQKAQTNAAPKFGLIIGTKTEKKAPVRNLMKRRLREIIRRRLLNKDEFDLSLYNAIVIVVRKGCLKATYQELEQKLTRCFRKKD